jgi:dTDP-4-amino-4,6-dideoxygalactose transaminase
MSRHLGHQQRLKINMSTEQRIPSPWPHYDHEQILAVSEVLSSGKVNYWTGNNGKLLEQEYAEYIGCNHAIAVANGTVALDLALHALDVGSGDEVITTSRTFIATASSIVLTGAMPVFADVDLDSQNITLATIKKVVTKKTKAIIVVHLAGWPCEMDDIMQFAEQNGIVIIEDCAQAHGAGYKGRKLGSIGHIAAFSFCQDKIMTTGGEGGMVTTNSQELWDKMWSYKDHGKSWQEVNRTDHPSGFRWLHSSFGTNYRMTEMQAAMGRIQLKRLDSWVKKRQIHCGMIWDNARKISALRVPYLPEYIQHAGYKCYVFLKLELLKDGWNKNKVINEISNLGIACFSGSCSEVYLEKAFENKEIRPENRLKNAEELGETALMFLVHPTMTIQEINRTNEVITSVMALATTGDVYEQN